MALLEVEGLVKYYGRRCVLNGVGFHVNRGEVVGLLGPNGAGKTTAFRIVIGMIKPKEGKVVFAGTDVTHWPMYRRARLGMGYLSQEQSIFRNMTVEENLLAILEFLPGKSRQQRREIVDALLQHFGLDSLRRLRARQLSGGEKRRLEMARCLASNPSLILLDEPFTGVDPKAIQDIQAIVRGLRDEGIGVLLTDHNVEQALRITDRAYVICDGRLLADGTPREIVESDLVRQRYLGEEFLGPTWLGQVA